MKLLKKSSGKYSSLAGNMLLFTISNFGSKIISFLLVPLYTYVLTTEEYGTVDLLSTTATLFIPILTLNIQDAALRFGMDENYSPKDVITTALRINGIGGTILAVALAVIGFTGLIDIPAEYLAFLFILYLFSSLNNTFTLYLKAKEKVSVLMVSGILNTLFMCVLNLLFLLVFRWGITGYLLAMSGASIVAVVYQLFAGAIYKDVELKREKNITREMLCFSIPLVANSLAWWINSASDRYILTFMCGVAANGIYSVAYKIPTILTTVQNIFYNAWSISAIKEFDKEDKDGFIGNIFSLYSFVSVMACSVIMIFNITISSVLYAKEFFEAWKCVPFLLVGTVFNGMALFEGCLFTAVKKTKEVSATTLVGAAVNIICNFIFIRYFGALGAALATMLGYVVSYIVRSVMMRKFIIMKINRPVIIVSYILLAIQSLVALDEKLWYIQIGLFVLLICIQYKYLLSFWKKIRTKNKNK